MALHVDLIRDSFTIATEREPALSERFYRRLFTRAPELELMFRRRGGAEQAEMLSAALVAVVDHLEDAPWLTATLGALGRRHRGYGVTPAMYKLVGDALLETLADICGDTWSLSHEAAWREAYGAIRALMLAGAHEEAAA